MGGTIVKTTYIVSGHMRTGTSMMMDALSKGGLKPTYSNNRDKIRLERSDKHYDANKCGLYELDNKEYQKYNFPKDYEGMLIKCMWYHLPILSAGKYKIVFMKRNPEEIRQSFMAFFGGSQRQLCDKYEERMQIAIDRLKMRGDVELTVFNYRDVVEDPEKHFNILKNSGWEIDVSKCASVVDKKLCRYKVEELEVGIV